MMGPSLIRFKNLSIINDMSNIQHIKIYYMYLVANARALVLAEAKKEKKYDT